MKKTIDRSTVDKLKTPFWLYFAIAVLLIPIGIILLPVWEGKNVFFGSWSRNSVDIILALIVALYVVFYVLSNKGFKKCKNMKLFKIIEVCLLSVLAVLCVAEYFGATDFIGPSFVFGAIFYLKGLILGIGAYKYSHKPTEKYSVWYLILSFVGLTAGTVLMIHPLGGDVFMWIISVALLAVALEMIIVGLISIPQKEAEQE